MRTEQAVLRISIVMTFLLAAFGVLYGLFIGSGSIIFDGIYSLMDASMTLVALLVSKLITASLGENTRAKLVKHFTMGFWHLEPMVLALSGVLLMGTALTAFIGAVGSLLHNGHEVEFGRAMIFAVIQLAVAVTMIVFTRRANRQIGSNFIELDSKAWMISAALTGALLIAFIFGWAIRGTSYDWMTPYVDPAVLAVVCLFVIPMPISTVVQALSDILLVTPADMKNHVDEVAARIVSRYGFLTYRAYVARVGRGKQIELYFIVPQGEPPRRLEEWDRIRDDIGHEIGDEGPDRWLTIAFTTDLDWAE
ncbi:cation diffusion facilitator family transporter [Paracoccus aminophilus]|uniref:Co/Zn/Cd cation transporter n=1 Tax=Paracoccus aminophilus JCM 7686 TaxID=1367847 RepID=S5YQH3_PARAH|nr:cation transporter [Paracoccus aminophilus]AGT07511.1 Co/Zn/Cd cation transporter [Paracoccus aminophilus JCM 7686]